MSVHKIARAAPAAKTTPSQRDSWREFVVDAKNGEFGSLIKLSPKAREAAMSVPVFPHDVSALFVRSQAEISTNLWLLLHVLAVRATIDASRRYAARSGKSQLAAQILLVEGARDLPGNAHAPGIDDELVRLLEVERGESN